MKVTLLTHTAWPMESIYAEWQQSRTEDLIHTSEEYHRAAQEDEELYRDIKQTFLDVLRMDLPAREMLSFTFLLEGIPVSLREHIVRHRIGHRFGQQLGVDIIPGAIDSSFWAQSMRVRDMGNFFINGWYYIPPAIEENPIALDIYEDILNDIQAAYVKLTSLGISPGDARQVIPLGATHRMTWTLTMNALASIFSRRTCWIAQLDMWEPLINGMLDELAAKIDPIFRRMADPPCFTRGNYTGCVFDKENVARCGDKDPELPCSLWVNKDLKDRSELYSDAVVEVGSRHEEYNMRMVQVGRMWGRDPVTGESYTGKEAL